MWFRSQNDKKDSEKALADAKRNLKRVQKRNEEVSEVADALKKIRERNHFAEELEAIVLRRKGPTS